MRMIQGLSSKGAFDYCLTLEIIRNKSIAHTHTQRLLKRSEMRKPDV